MRDASEPVLLLRRLFSSIEGKATEQAAAAAGDKRTRGRPMMMVN